MPANAWLRAIWLPRAELPIWRLAASRDEQLWRSEPVHPGAEHSLSRERNCEQLLFGIGGCDQLQANGHAGAIAPDRHCNRTEPQIIDRDRVADYAAVDPGVAVGIGDVR